MKVLLDENLPEELKDDLRAYDVFTAREKKWKGKKNSELMLLLQREKFDLLITTDKNLRYQQNLSKYRISILLIDINQNTYPVIRKLVPKILKALRQKPKMGITTID